MKSADGGGVPFGAEGSSDRLIVRLDAKGPIELAGLTDSFAALARFYERHFRDQSEPTPKLFVTRLETGSIIAEIVPLVMLFGQALPVVDASLKVGDFIGRLSKAIKAFSGVSDATVTVTDPPSRRDAQDIREFIKPLTGRGNGNLRLSHARYSKRDGNAEMVVEYQFDEGALNRAAVNIDQALRESDLLATNTSETASAGILREVMLFFDQASRAPSKEQGRTGDRGIVPEVSDKSLPVHFRKSVNDLKDRMIRGDQNPLIDTFVVDVHVQYVGEEPKGYIVTELHKIIPADE